MPKSSFPKVALTAVALSVLLSPCAHATGFKLPFQSPAAFANEGNAALAEDASTNWYNPAGLVYVPHQLIASGFLVAPNTLFTGQAKPSAGGSFSDVRERSKPLAFIPSFHYAYPINDKWAFGLSANPVWGLSQDYGEHSAVRYELVRIDTKSVDVVPSLAMKYNDHWSFAAGPDINYFSAKSRSAVLIGVNTDAISRFDADNWSYGGHLAALYRMNDQTRFGLTYRTQFIMTLDGDSDFITSSTINSTNNFSIRVPVPPVTSFSAYHDMTPCWAVMGTVTYDQWSVLKGYHAKNVAGADSSHNYSDVYQPQNYRDAFEFGVGTRYKFTPNFSFSSSVKYLQTPTVSEVRSLTFPDGDTLGINLGAHYQLNNKIGFDVAYAHVFLKKSAVYDENPITHSIAQGKAKSYINILGAQVVWNI